jgi:hypothetical protein
MNHRRNVDYFVRTGVFTAVGMKMAVFWAVPYYTAPQPSRQPPPEIISLTALTG